MRRHVTGSSTTQRTSRRSILASTGARANCLLDGRHSVLERTTGSKVLAAANTALDLLVFELVLHTTLLSTLLFLLSLRLPVHAGSENDILANRGRVERRTSRVALFESEFAPAPPLGDLWVDMFSHDVGFDTAGHLHFLAVIVETVGDDGLRAIFVRSHLLRGERGGVIELLVVGPVGAAKFLNLVRKYDSKVGLSKYSLS